MIDTEILQDYSSEARELLDEMDNSLIRLEKEGGTPELLNNIFRAVHCIKGSAEYIGLERSSTLTHGIENLLDRLREGVAQLTPEIVDFLFRAKDVISTLISEVAQEHVEKSEISGVMSELDLFLQEQSSPTPDSRFTETQPVISEEPAEQPEPEDSVTDYPEIPDEGLTADSVTTTTTGEDEEEEPSAEGEDEYGVLADELVDSAEEPDDDTEPYTLETTTEEEYEPGEEDTEEDAFRDELEAALDYHDEADSALPEDEEMLEEATLEDTVPHILSISLYLDDLQDGLNPEDAFSSIVEKIHLLKESLTALIGVGVVDTLETMESQLALVDLSSGAAEAEQVETLRSLLHDLRPHFPGDLFPLEPRREPEQEDPTVPLEAPQEVAPEPSPFVQELERVPGMAPTVAQAILDAGFSSMEQLGQNDLSTLNEISGMTPDLAEALLSQTKVIPEEPKQPQPHVVGRPADKSLLADVDDELLREFEGIFSEPDTEELSADAPSPGGRAADLLEELDSISADADREIMEIFLSYGWEILDKIRPHVTTINQGTIDRNDLDACAELIKSIRSSSTYMDYQNLASFLDEWYEKTLWVVENMESLSVSDFRFMEESLLRFQDFLAGLDAALNPESVTSPSFTATPQAEETLPQVTPEPEPEPEPEVANVEAVEHTIEQEVEPGVISAQDEAYLQETPTHELEKAQEAQATEPAPASIAQPPQEIGPVPETDLEKPFPVQADLPQDSALVKTMRVDAGKVDILLNQVGELVVNRSYVEQLFSELKDFQRILMSAPRIDKKEVAAIKDITLKVGEASLSLGRVATDIQEGVMKLRMLPVGQLFNRMPRLIRDLSRRVGKVVNLEVYGGDTEVDKRVIEQIYNPLVHLIRNAVDHGIEETDTRKRKGKTEEGFIGLRAYSEGNQVVIDVEDDGGGIDSEAVLRKAVESRLVDPQEIKNVSAQEIHNFLFMPGFSTSEKVTRTSGRGVGMDVVKKDVEKINGHIEIESWEGRGTRISIKIPLTLAIIQTLLIKNGNHVFAVPLTSVREIIQITMDEITTIEGFEVIKFRDETIPVLRVNEIFNLKKDDKSSMPRFLVLATAGLKTVGFLVEELIGEQDVVIKPLAEHVCEIRGLAGSTILGDGTIALVMDVTEIIDDIIFQQRQLAMQVPGIPYPQEGSRPADTTREM
jgi:two-component system chemotaxis sensor kinase CheA